MSKIERVLLKNAMKVGTPTFSFRVEVDEKTCTGCAKCVIECPAKIIEMTPRETTGACDSACTDACHASNGIRDAIKAFQDGGTAEEAWKIITRTNPFPAVTGRTCPHPCEDECSRNVLDASVNIHQFERFIGDYAIEKGLSFPKPAISNKGSVAVVGAGPSGLGAAYHLALFGYKVTVFEAEAKPGGVLRYGIPAYRLPRDILDKEIKRLTDLGVEIKCGVKFGVDVKPDDLRKNYKAVFLALGVQEEINLGFAGECAENCFSGMGFLHDAAEGTCAALGNDVIVIGGGNVAIDSSRSALRTGARNVTLVCLEKKHEMPAWDTEVDEAVREGVKLVTGYGPMKFIAENGKIAKIVFKRCTRVFDRDGKFAPEYDDTDKLEIPCESAIVSIGQKPAEPAMLRKMGLKTAHSGHVVLADEKTQATLAEGVFAGGDLVKSNTGGLIIGAIGAGQNAAHAIDAYIAGTAAEAKRSAAGKPSYPEGFFVSEIPRNETKSIFVSARFTEPPAEVNVPYPEKTAKDEVARCLQCGLGKAKYIGEQLSDNFNVACNNCHNCVAVCEEKAIQFHYFTKKKNGKWVA